MPGQEQIKLKEENIIIQLTTSSETPVSLFNSSLGISRKFNANVCGKRQPEHSLVPVEDLLFQWLLLLFKKTNVEEMKQVLGLDCHWNGKPLLKGGK